MKSNHPPHFVCKSGRDSKYRPALPDLLIFLNLSFGNLDKFNGTIRKHL